MIKKLLFLFLMGFWTLSFSDAKFQLWVTTKNKIPTSEWIDLYVCDDNYSCEKNEQTFVTTQKNLSFIIRIVRPTSFPKKAINVTYNGCPNPGKNKHKNCQWSADDKYYCVETLMTIPNTGAQGNATLTITFKQTNKASNQINIAATCSQS